VDALNGEIQFRLERFLLRGRRSFLLSFFSDELRPTKIVSSPFVLCRLLTHDPTLPSFGARNKE
jgi:hypothetical protein